ncbi:MAG: DUF2318 domain-containing protein [Bifidobacteriaceae bacterium]|nr:DUF2318 domain-containing protein [Bifidobacteriaceae bacterium]
MLGQFIQVIVGAMPLAVVLSLSFALVRPLERGKFWAGALKWGAVAGAVGGVALTVLRETTTLVNRETVNLWIVTPAVVLELGLVVWLWLSRPGSADSRAASRRLAKSQAELGVAAGAVAAASSGTGEALPGRPGERVAADGVGGLRRPTRLLRPNRFLLATRLRRSTRLRRLGGFVGAGALGLAAGLLALRAVPAVALQLTSFVVPGESPASTEMLLRVLGFAAGATLVLLTAAALYVCAKAAPRVATLVCASAGFGIVIVFQLVLVARAIRAQWYMTFPSWLFRSMAWLINHERVESAALIVVSLAVPLSIWIANRRGAAAAAAADCRTPAASRLLKAQARRRRRYSGVVMTGYAAAALAVTVGVAIESREPQLSPPEQFDIVGELAVIDLDAIDDGHLHRFAYTTSSGVEVRFIVIKKNGVAYGVGLDACEVCGPTGYYEKDGKIICRLCDVIMNVATIGFKGGCNPIPLEYELDGGQLTVTLAQLEANSGIFA